jgi:hypothetical protein
VNGEEPTIDLQINDSNLDHNVGGPLVAFGQ